MHTKLFSWLFTLTLVVSVAIPAGAQEVLPFPPKPSASAAGRTMQESIPKSSATVAEVLKDYGYHTGAWGKWHTTPAEHTTAAGPFEYWPTGWVRRAR